MNKDIMIKAGFVAEMKLVDEGKCPFCKKPINPAEFKDDSSRKEFGVSGLCQVCQDEVYK
jgi:hypothetical protein